MNWFVLFWYCFLFCFAYESRGESDAQQQKKTIGAAFEQLQFRMKSNYELSSLPQLRVIRNQARHYDQHEIVVKTILIEASIRQHFGDYKHSLAMHYQALEMAERLNKPQIMIETLLAIVYLELDLERYDHAERYIKQAIPFLDELAANDELFAYVKLWQARIYLKKGSYRQAQYEVKLARTIPIKNETLAAELVLIKAQIALKLGNHRFSQQLLIEFYTKYHLIVDVKTQLNYQVILAESALQSGEFTRAIAEAKAGLERTFHTRYLEEQANLQRLLASAYAQLGNYQEAHLFLKRYLLTERALNQQKRNNKVLQLEAQYALAQQKQQVRLLEKDNDIQAQKIAQQQQVLENAKLTQQRWLLLGVLVFGIVLVAYWRWQNRRYTSRLEQQVTQRTIELKERNERLQALSFTDSLTGLNNRHYFFSTIGSQIKALSPKHDMIFCIIDIDHFKKINDCYGHAAGDLVLQNFADILKQCTRNSDLLIRWGGEEFLLVMPDMSRDQAQEVVERIRLQVECFPFIVNGQTVQCTCSIGFAPYPLIPDALTQPSWEQILELADNGLYLAKEANRNMWVGLHCVNMKEPLNIDYLLKNYREQIRLGNIIVSTSYADFEMLA